MLIPILFASIVAIQTAAMPGTGVAPVEPPPAAGERSPLQIRIDRAAPGEVIDVGPGEYRGDLVIDRSVQLIGRGRPVLVGSGRGSVVRVRAADVRIEGFDIDGRGGGDLSRDSSGIHVSAPRATIRGCRIRRSLFGIYLREANGSIVDGCTITGRPELAPGDQGSGIHVFDTDGFRLVDNTIEYTRDGIYIQSSPHGFIARNVARRLRYGLHYMFSDDNTFEDNRFEEGAAGAALMYSRRLAFRRNQFLHNRGFASVGLLLQVCDDVTAEDNLIADNARGVFLEGVHRNTFTGNAIAESDVAIVLYDSVQGVRFQGNSFVANLSPVQFVGRRTDTVFDRNYWAGSAGSDLDGDGVEDSAFRLTNVFDHLRGNLAAADLFAGGIGAAVLGRAEQMFPVLDPSPLIDPRPLARAPRLAHVPRPDPARRSRRIEPLAASIGAAALGLWLFAADRRRVSR